MYRNPRNKTGTHAVTKKRKRKWTNKNLAMKTAVEIVFAGKNIYETEKRTRTKLKLVKYLKKSWKSIPGASLSVSLRGYLSDDRRRAKSLLLSPSRVINTVIAMAVMIDASPWGLLTRTLHYVRTRAIFELQCFVWEQDERGNKQVNE